jgi:DNA-binding FadR family transcriptional regulator
MASKVRTVGKSGTPMPRTAITVRGSPDTDRRVRLPKAGEIVARNLRNRIIRGELPEGTMLPSEQELVHQFGVSRPTLREAIRILESEQLLEITRGLRGGARVLKPNIEVAARYFGFLLQANAVTLTSVFRTRVMIEPAAVRCLAREKRPESVKRLKDCLEQADATTEVIENALAFSQFHHILVEETNNPTLIMLMGMLNTILDQYLVSVGAVFGQYIEAKAEMAKARRSRWRLVELIEQGEEDKAANLWRHYLQEAEVKLGKWQPSELVVDLLQSTE